MNSQVEVRKSSVITLHVREEQSLKGDVMYRSNTKDLLCSHTPREGSFQNIWSYLEYNLL